MVTMTEYNWNQCGGVCNKTARSQTKIACPEQYHTQLATLFDMKFFSLLFYVKLFQEPKNVCLRLCEITLFDTCACVFPWDPLTQKRKEMNKTWNIQLFYRGKFLIWPHTSYGLGRWFLFFSTHEWTFPQQSFACINSLCVLIKAFSSCILNNLLSSKRNVFWKDQLLNFRGENCLAETFENSVAP